MGHEFQNLRDPTDLKINKIRNVFKYPLKLKILRYIMSLDFLIWNIS
jgi:hypothetical protein